MAATATYLDIWIMRRTVNYVRVGYSSVSYAMWLLCRDIRGRELPDLIDTLLDKLAHDDDVSFEGSPSRNRRGIADLGVNQFSRRYIFHLLARLTAYTDVGAGKPDMFDKYVDRSPKNPYDIEHLWADQYHPYSDMFTDEQEFRDWRNHIAGLVLLPADVNRSLQDKPYAEKVPHYAKQNTYAASLTSAAYKNQPQFNAFRDREQLPFRPYAEFGRVEQQERRELVLALANRVWAPERLEKLRP